jgi:hypothetical protein
MCVISDLKLSNWNYISLYMLKWKHQQSTALYMIDLKNGTKGEFS